MDKVAIVRCIKRDFPRIQELHLGDALVFKREESSIEGLWKDWELISGNEKGIEILEELNQRTMI